MTPEHMSPRSPTRPPSSRRTWARPAPMPSSRPTRSGSLATCVGSGSRLAATSRLSRATSRRSSRSIGPGCAQPVRHPGQQPPDRGGGGVHRHRLRGQGPAGAGPEGARLLDGEASGCDTYAEILEKFSDEPLGDEPRGIDMLYSSGTTGRPKRVMPPLSGKQVGEAGADAYTAVFGQIFSLFAETIYNSCVPTYHAAPLRFGGIVSALGGTLVISQRFDAERRWRSTGSRTVSGCRRCSYACLSCPTPLVKGRVSSRSIQRRRDVGVDESSSVEGEGQQPDWCRCLRFEGFDASDRGWWPLMRVLDRRGRSTASRHPRQ